MKRVPSFSLVFVMCAAMVAAQPGGQSPQADQSSAGKSSLATIQGCLQRSQGNYILVDEDNTFRRLSNNGKLKGLLGHEVRLTGKPAIRTIDTTQPGTASTAVEQRYFEVKSVEDVSPNCQANPQ